MNIKNNEYIANYRNFKFVIDNGDVRLFEYEDSNDGYFYYKVFDKNKKPLGKFKTKANESFKDRFIFGKCYTINNKEK